MKVRLILHPLFVTTIRHAWEQRRTQSWFAGTLYWETDSGRIPYCPPLRDHRRIKKLAATLQYDGPIFVQVSK